MSIGENIRHYRIKKGFTQKKLAELTGIAEITIRQYELGKYEPKRDNLYKLRKALDVNIYQLYGTSPDYDEINFREEMMKYNNGFYIPRNMENDDRKSSLLKAIDTISKKAIGQRITKSRESKNISKHSLAEKSELTVQDIKNYEQGVAELNASELLNIADVLKVDVWDLLGTDRNSALDNFSLENFNNYVSDKTKSNELELFSTLLRDEGYTIPITSSKLNEILEEKTENDFLNLFDTVGYEVTKIDGGMYKVYSNRYRWSFNISKEDLAKLETSIMDYASYTTDSYFRKLYDKELEKKR